MINEKIELIKHYMRLGWKVIPLNGKTPIWNAWNDVEKWVRGFYSNNKTIEAVKENPTLNIGVLTGVLSGIIAVDVDEPEICSYNPEPFILRGSLAHMTSKAPRLIFRSVNPEVLNFNGKVMVDGKVVFEVLGTGRQFMAPPSIHPSKQVEFEWITPLPNSMNEVMEIKDLNHLKAILLEIFQGSKLVSQLFPELKPSKEISSELLQQWFNQIVEEKLASHIAREHANYISFHCPFHPPDNHPSFVFYKNTYLFVDFHDNQIYTVKQMAEQLGLRLEAPRMLRDELEAEKLKEILDEVLSHSNALEWIKAILDEAIVGEDENKLLLMLITISKDLEEPQHALIEGASGIGKTHLVSNILKAIPSGDVETVSRVTPAALDYLKDRLKHKVLWIQQLGGMEASRDTLHVMMTEKGLKLLTVKRGEGGIFEPYEVEAEGPLTFISTTVSGLTLDTQFITRVWRIFPDESEEQTRKIQEFNAKLKMYPWLQKEIDEKLRKISYYIKFLSKHGLKKVIVPYADKIILPSRNVRVRRDQKKLLELISVIAYVNQLKRPIIEVNGEKYIFAIKDDFDWAIKILGKTIEKAISDLSKREEEILEICHQLEEEETPITSKEVSRRHRNVSQRTALRILNRLVEKGYLFLEIEGKGKKPNIYSVNPEKPSISAIAGLADIEFPVSLKELVERWIPYRTTRHLEEDTSSVLPSSVLPSIHLYKCRVVQQETGLKLSFSELTEEAISACPTKTDMERRKSENQPSPTFSASHPVPHGDRTTEKNCISCMYCKGQTCKVKGIFITPSTTTEGCEYFKPKTNIQFVNFDKSTVDPLFSSSRVVNFAQKNLGGNVKNA